MIIKSKAGTEISKNGYTVIDELNEIPLIKTNYLQLEHNHINPILLMSKAFEHKDAFVNVVEDTKTSGDTAFKEYNAIHEFAWILSGMRKHDSYTGYLSLEQFLTMVLQDTGFTYQVEGGHQYYAQHFENLGDGESHLDMFFKMLNRWNTEFELRGRKVYITHQRGRLRDKHVGRYKMNIIDTIINSDITDGATAVYGYFGKVDEENPKNSTYREFYWQIDELVEQYGIRYAKPYSNENITQEETMIEYLNNILLDSWKISTEVDVAEITDEVAQTGDEYVAVDERLGIKLSTRIQKLESVYDVDDTLLYQTATLGTVSFASSASGNNLQSIIENVKKDYNDRITDLKQEFDNRFNDEVTQIEIDFNDLVESMRDEIEADNERFKEQYNYDKQALETSINNSYTDAVKEASNLVEQSEKDYDEKLAQTKREQVERLAEVNDNIESIQDTIDNVESIAEADRNTFNQSLTDLRKQVRQIDLSQIDAGEQLIEINQTLDEVKGTFDIYATKTYVDNIQVGGVNLIENTEYIFIGQLSKKVIIDAIFGLSSDYHTLSFDAILGHFYDTRSKQEIEITYTLGDMFDAEYVTRTETIDVSELAKPREIIQKRLHKTIDTKGYYFIAEVYIDTTKISAEVVQFSNFQFEQGNKPTAYSKSPEDAEAKIATLTQETAQLRLDTNTVQIQANKIQQSADKLSQDLATLTVKNNEITSSVSSLTTDLSTTKQELATTTTKANSVTTTVANIIDGKAPNGSVFKQMSDSVLNRVWQNDIDNLRIGGTNLIPRSDYSVQSNVDRIIAWGSATIYESSPMDFPKRFVIAQKSGATPGDTLGFQTRNDRFKVLKDEEYTLSFLYIVAANVDVDLTYTYLMRENGGQILSLTSRKQVGVAFNTFPVYKAQFTFKANWTDDKAWLLIGSNVIANGNATLRVSKPKLETGNKATDWSAAPEDSLKYTDLVMKHDGFMLGSFELGGDKIAQAIVGKAGSIDLIADNVNLSNNLSVANLIKAKSLEAVYADINKLRTNVLTANSVTADALKVDTALINKLNTNSLLTNYLIADTALIDAIKAQSIEAVYANISEVRTRLLSANVITAEMLKVDTALFDLFTSNTAFISSLTGKSAFIRDIQAIEVTANQLNIQTLHNKLKGAEGGLTIYGPDGRVMINNSILGNTFSIHFIQPHFMGIGVDTSGNYFRTTNTSYTTAAAFSFLRGGRYITIDGFCEMRSAVAGSADTTVGAIRLMEFTTGARSAFIIIESRKTNENTNQRFKITIDMGVPQYEQRNFYVQFYTANAENAALFRINQAYYHG